MTGTGSRSDVLGIFSNMALEKKHVPKEQFLEFLNVFREEQGREVVIGVVEDLRRDRPYGDRPGDTERPRPA